jgi:hypothetical protein
MTHVVVAATLAISLFFSLQGAIYGTYVIITMLGLNVGMIILSASLSMTPEVKINSSSMTTHLMENFGSMLLVRLMLLLSIWHIYTIGYTFIAGVATVTVLITIFSMIIRKLESMAEDAK